MEKLHGFNQYRHKTLQILKNLISSSFVLIQKKQKIKAYTSRRPANNSTANKIMFRFAQRNFVLTPFAPSGFPACEVYAIFIC
jgi:hypothetical protein